MKKRDGYIRSAGGNFPCRSCGKLTRATNETLALEICPVCYEIGGLQNSLSDGCITSTEFMAQIESIPGYNGTELDDYTKHLLEEAKVEEGLKDETLKAIE